MAGAFGIGTLAGAIALGIATLSGCASKAAFQAPAGWPVPTRPGPGTGYGAWGYFMLKPSSVAHDTLIGELIAIENDSTSVLTSQGLVMLPTADVTRALLAVSYERSGKITVWHRPEQGHFGKFLRSHPERDPRLRMRAYARFPQGVPAGVDPRALTLPR